MLMIRLQRVGRKNDPSFRVIVTDSKNAAKRGRPTEIVGSYDARKGSPVLDAERIKYWTSQGAQVSGTVNNLLVDAKIVIGKKVNVLPKKTPIVKPAPAPEVKAPVAAKAEPASAEATDETEAEVAASEATPEATSETAV